MSSLLGGIWLPYLHQIVAYLRSQVLEWSVVQETDTKAYLALGRVYKRGSGLGTELLAPTT